MSTLIRLGNTFVRIITTQPCWPDSEESVGSYFGTVDGEKYWRLKDQQCSAFLAFESLVGKLEKLLRKHTETSAIRVLWRAYMIGEEASLCFLGILFCCTDADYRNLAARKIESSSKVLIPSGVIIKYRSGLPRSHGNLMLLGNEGKHRYFSASSTVQPGSAVHAESSDGTSQVATLGGRIKIDGVDYFVTSAHPFTTENFGARSTRRRDQSSESRKQAIGSLYYSSYTDGYPELDYVLIQPDSGISMVDDIIMTHSQQHAELELPRYATKKLITYLQDTKVQSNRGSTGPSSGQIETIPDFLRSDRAKPQEVYAVQFDSDLAPGDSGSWVFDAAGNILYGHIVAGVPEDGLAFIVPAYKVFENIEETLQQLESRTLPVPRQWNSVSPDSIDLLPHPAMTYLPSGMSNAPYGDHPYHSEDPSFYTQSPRPWSYLSPSYAESSRFTSAHLEAPNATVQPVGGVRRYEQQAQRVGPYDGVGYVRKTRRQSESDQQQ